MNAVVLLGGGSDDVVLQRNGSGGLRHHQSGERRRHAFGRSLWFGGRFENWLVREARFVTEKEALGVDEVYGAIEKLLTGRQ